MPILGISSLEYLRTRNNSQIKADFIDYLRMAHEGIPDYISSVYRRLAASEVVKSGKRGKKLERREIHAFKMSENNAVFLNMLECFRIERGINREIPWIQMEASRMMIDLGLNYTEIGKRLGCHRDTAKQYADRVLTLLVERLRQEAEKQAKLER